MEQNTISLSEIIQLMKEVKQNTDNFIEDLSLFQEKCFPRIVKHTP